MPSPRKHAIKPICPPTICVICDARLQACAHASDAARVLRIHQADLAALGRTIQRHRQAQGFSQEALADESGLHRNYIGGIERGERNFGVRVLFRIADALHLPPSTLFEN